MSHHYTLHHIATVIKCYSVTVTKLLALTNSCGINLSIQGQNGSRGERGLPGDNGTLTSKSSESLIFSRS